MSSSRRSSSLLLPLACPACGGNLDPLREDLLFLCAACGAASELVGERTVRREMHHSTPPEASRPMHLPFWRLGAKAVAPAFNASRLLTVSRWYSEKAASLDAHPGGPAPRGLWGGRIGAADAWRIHALAADHTATASARERGFAGRRSIEDYRATAGAAPPLRIDPPADSPAPVLFAVPFLREASRLVCALTGLHLYLETLEGSEELLARWDKVYGLR